LAAKPSDEPAQIMLARCGEFLASPPGKDWEATNAMKVK
jgi:adenylate cyclase